MKHFRAAALALMVLASCAQPLGAGKVEADANKDYSLIKKNGPWMIMVASFYARQSTPKARQDTYEKAKALVMELRRDHKIRAYTYHMRTSFGNDIGTVRYDVQGKAIKARVREFDQVAVLAGDFADAEQAQPVLRKIKAIRDVKCMRDMRIGAPSKAKGPLWKAFVTTNPYVPDEYLRSNEPDRLLLQMNSGLLSLFDCPARYTVMVAAFGGLSIVDYHEKKLQAFSDQLDERAASNDRLERAAIEAFELAKALRAKGWEAYVFHDRRASIVTVGGFNSPNDPRMKTVVETFQAKTIGSRTQPMKLDRWQFDAQPMPIEVPRRG